MGDDGAEEHVVGSGDLVAGHHGADHVGAGDGDDGKLLFAVGFFFGGDFGFALELAFPTIEVGFDSTALALAEVVEFEERAVLFAVVEGGLDHGGGGGFDPGVTCGEGEVSDSEFGVFGEEEGDGEGPEDGDKFHGRILS